MRRSDPGWGISESRTGDFQRAPSEQSDEWAEGRRYLGLDILARSRMNAVTDTNTGIDTGPEEVSESLLELSA